MSAPALSYAAGASDASAALPTHLASLNPEQLAAATTDAAAALVLAGPGSGKTKTLIARIVHLIEQDGAPDGILAVTFSRRATAELRHRLAQMLPEETAAAVRVSTLHAYALGLVRTHAGILGLSERVTVANPDDVTRHMKKWLIKQEAEVQQLGVQSIMDSLAAQRATAFLEAMAGEASEAWKCFRTMPEDAPAYAHYWSLLTDQHTLDLELVVPLAALLLRASPAARATATESLRDVLLDEFQDTSHDQWELLAALAPPGGTVRLFAVGDDAQSIYGWRGATLANMDRLVDGYPGCARSSLEQNYRSAPRIVRAANEILPRTGSRFPRTLWTESEHPTAIQVVTAATPHDEARYVVQRLQDLRSRGSLTQWREALVLYRTNAVASSLEEAFREARIPYRLSSGRRFFERPEIQGVVGCLQAAVNPWDRGAADRAFSAIYPKPTAKAVEALQRAAEDRQTTVWQVLAQPEKVPGLPPGQWERLQAAARLVEQVRAAATPAEAVALVDTTTTLRARLLAAIPAGDPTVHTMPEREFWRWYAEAEARVEAVDSLRRLAEQFTAHQRYESWLDGPERGVPREAWTPDVPLVAFLDDLATLLDESEALEHGGIDAVQCMTVHAAKGLEAPAVFVVGLNEGEFPVLSAVQQPGRKTPDFVAHEEEARVFFVAVTRAQQYLHLTSSRAGRRRGGGRGGQSRFLAWLPDMTYVLQDRT